jgi:3-phenylpropionate/cinnamic acid dioxygenase small subunit
MPKAKSGPQETRKHRTKGGLTRETAYLYDDEEKSLEQRAEKERTSKSEIIRRALRAYLQIQG